MSWRETTKSPVVVKLLYVLLKVRIELYTNSTLAGYAWFDARGADKWSWMSVERLLASSWDDIKDYASSNTPLASVAGIMQCIMRAEASIAGKPLSSNHTNIDLSNPCVWMALCLCALIKAHTQDDIHILGLDLITHQFSYFKCDLAESLLKWGLGWVKSFYRKRECN